MTRYSEVSYTYSGGSKVFTIPFSYLKTEHINVFIDDVEVTDFEFNTTSQIQINDEITSGQVVKIVRTTPIDSRMVNFNDRSVLNAQQQNLDSNQLFNVVQEVYDKNDNFTEDIQTQVDTANTNASAAVSTANTANSKADTAVSTANAAETKADNAVSTANSAISIANIASTNATNAVNTANSASSAATAASNKVDEFGQSIETVVEAASKINQLEQSVTTATNAAQTATNKADETQEVLSNAVTEMDSKLNIANIAVENAMQQANIATQKAQEILDINPANTDLSNLTEEGIQVIKDKSNGYRPPLLQSFWSDHILNRVDLLRADTFSWQRGEVYTAAYNELLVEYNNENSVEETEAYKINVDSVGSVKNSNGLLSNFSTSNYASFDIGTTTTADLVEFIISFNTGSWSDTTNQACSLLSGTNFPILQIYNQKANLGSNNTYGTYTYSTNEDVTWKISIQNGTMNVYRLNDSNEFELDYTVAYSTAVSGTVILGSTPSVANRYLAGGFIDLKDTYVNINGSRLWSGADVIQYKRTPKGYKIADSSQELAILNKYNTDGIAWYYILDTVNTQFKLPRTKFGFEGLRDSVGNDIAESLPQHTHSFTQHERTAGGSSNIALYNNGYNASNNYKIIVSKADNPTYQDNAPVQERATQMYLYFYVGNFTQSAIEQTAGINTELFNNKADVDLNNLSSTGAKKFDGEWTYLTNYIRIFEKVTPPVNGSVLTYDLSAYLPNDGAIYECLFNGMCITGTTSGNSIALFLATDLTPSPTTNYVAVCATKTRVSSADSYNRSSSILAVGTGRKLILVGSTNNRNGDVTCDLVAYRRLGKTN